MYFICFCLGYVAGLTIIGAPLVYIIPAGIAQQTLYEVFLDLDLIPLHIGVLLGLTTILGLLFKKKYKALLIPPSVIIGLMFWHSYPYFILSVIIVLISMLILRKFC